MHERSEKEIEQLIQYSIGFADNALREHGEFYPFASYIGLIGELVPIVIHPGTEYPDSSDLVIKFESLLNQMKNEDNIVAYAIAIDVRMQNDQFPQFTDAIAIKTFQLQRERQITYYFPYKKEKETVQILEGWGEVV